MRQYVRTLTIPVLVLAGAALAACSSSSGGGTTDPPGPTTASLSGDVMAVRTLSPDTTYMVVGFLEIQPGARLVIPAGTVILSDPATKGTIVTLRCSGDLPSGQLIVQGTAAQPVVFRPAAAGARTRGLGGGIILHGCAPINVPGGTGVSEGVSRPFGGNNAADNSGEIHYLRIEFGGVKVTPDNEINGLTMSGVGSGTVIDHVQAHFIADDGFEWFGGTVNAKFLLSSGNDDDNFDCDFGWSGTVQFFAAIQDRALANRGVECDNDAGGSANAPITNPSLWNATFIGAGVEIANNEANDGIFIRRNTRGTWRNLIIANFGNQGITVDGVASQENLTGGTMIIDNVLFHRILCIQAGGCQAAAADPVLSNIAFRGGAAAGYHQTGVAAAFAGLTILEADPLLATVNYDNPINGAAPDLRPAAGSPALVQANAATPVGPGVDGNARYLGAFSGDNWISGWTTWATN